jgi:hypothetical protein
LKIKVVKLGTHKKTFKKVTQNFTLQKCCREDTLLMLPLWAGSHLIT